MSAPTPDTRSAIVLLNGSNVSASGTWKTPLIAIQLTSAAVLVERAKTKQLQRKLTSTAAIEIELLRLFHRRVNSVIRPALTSGVSRMSHGNSKFIELQRLEFQAANVLDVGRLLRAIKRDKDGKANGDFGRCYSDDEKYKHLCVVVRQAVCIDSEPREGNQRKVRCVQHQFQ